MMAIISIKALNSNLFNCINRLLLVTCILSAVSLRSAKCQTNGFPVIGQFCPPFSFNNVEGWPEGTVLTSESLKGEFVILDFWTTGCTQCIASFPKMNSIQKKYSQDLKIILVGLEEKGRDVKKYYQIYKRRLQLNLISAFDSIQFLKLVPRGVPHYIWIGKNGKIVAITSIDDVSEQNVEKFIAEKPFEFTDVSYSRLMSSLREVDVKSPLLINGNGGRPTEYLFRSLLAKWEPGKGRSYIPNIINFKLDSNVRYQAFCAPILSLYMVAYLGSPTARSSYPTVYPWPIINTKDSLRFIIDGSNKERYNYCLEAPVEKADANALMAMMRRDLENFFGYHATFKQKDMPCLKLIIIDEQKAKNLIPTSNSLVSTWNPEIRENKLNNISMDNLPSILAYRLSKSKYVTQNATGIKGNVSLVLNANIEDLESIRMALSNYGLDFMPTTISIKTLEISDAN